MDEILKKSFSNEAQIYDETTQYLLLDYDAMLQDIVRNIPHQKDDEFILLDLGCGTGNLLRLISNNFPNAILYGLDFSANMLDIAKTKCLPNDRIKFVEMDMFDLGKSSLPYFDVIVSSYVLHNLHNKNQYEDIVRLINEHLVFNGTFILADLVDLQDAHKHTEYIAKLVSQMRKHNLTDEEIIRWIGILECEDSPLPLNETIHVLNRTFFTDLNINEYHQSASTIVKAKNNNLITLKLELLFCGVQKNDIADEVYAKQNPQNIWKTGNNGIFISLDNKYDVLVGLNHQSNALSPYRFSRQGKSYKLIKNEHVLNVAIDIMQIPEWAYKQVGSENVSDYFVYEGGGYLHLAYKGCSFDEKQKCKFCSTSRRESSADHSAEEISNILSAVLKEIPDDVHFCLGGGTYLPFSENVEYFKTIIKCIRDNGKTNPIWVECIPPSIEDIDALIDEGATAFGFNLEIWNNEKRKSICPGKSKVSRDYYLKACRHILEKCGPNKVGSCIIVGLDDRKSVVQSIEALTNLGIIPCILPYKDFGTGNFSVQGYVTYDFYWLSKYAASFSTRNDIEFQKSQGCLKCPCCTVIHDIQKQEKGEQL